MSSDSGRLSLKVVIRCRDFEASRRFYGEILGLAVLEEWEEKGGQGCIFAFPDGSSLEVYQMTPQNKRYDAAFERAFQDDKIDISRLNSWKFSPTRR